MDKLIIKNKPFPGAILKIISANVGVWVDLKTALNIPKSNGEYIIEKVNNLETKWTQIGKKNVIALLELEGTGFDQDLKIKDSLSWLETNYDYNNIPIVNTKASVQNTLDELNKYYKLGYRIFIGFNRSSMLDSIKNWFTENSDAIGISLTSTSDNIIKPNNIYRLSPPDSFIIIPYAQFIKTKEYDWVGIISETGDNFSQSLSNNLEIIFTNKGISYTRYDKRLTTGNLNDVLSNSLTKIKPLIIPLFVSDRQIYLDNYAATFGQNNVDQIDNIGDAPPTFSQQQKNDLNGKYYFLFFNKEVSRIVQELLDNVANASTLIYDAMRMGFTLSLSGDLSKDLVGSVGYLYFNSSNDRNNPSYTFSLLNNNEFKKNIIYSLIESQWFESIPVV